ncbi:hypothetical protein [Aureibacillus halotolerans]|uniref:hypothetical protein n=1 Tax=Aureibacillus halotolerans TaxID=1508390 RepID=UPI00105E6E07|nr:hypothetical protein [Aureibacillus halotolerans]
MKEKNYTPLQDKEGTKKALQRFKITLLFSAPRRQLPFQADTKRLTKVVIIRQNGSTAIRKAPFKDIAAE